LRVTVTQDLPVGHRPAEFSLLRWIQDPLLELPTTVPTDGASGGTSASSGVSL
jgi:hypothetical protein